MFDGIAEEEDEVPGMLIKSEDAVDELIDIEDGLGVALESVFDCGPCEDVVILDDILLIVGLPPGLPPPIGVPPPMYVE